MLYVAAGENLGPFQFSRNDLHFFKFSSKITFPCIPIFLPLSKHLKYSLTCEVVHPCLCCTSQVSDRFLFHAVMCSVQRHHEFLVALA